ncbi:unnamed protein product [Alopecurus aequalis]
MELRSLQNLDVDDSISIGWLADHVRHSLGSTGSSFIDMYPDDVRHSLGSPGSSFIDMYPDELFNARWTTAAASDFDFDLPVAPDGTASPVVLYSASRIFRGGLLLPCEPGTAQEHGDGVDVVPNVPQRSDSSSPLFDLAQRRTPNSCSGAMSDAGGKLGTRQPIVCACGTFSPPWKVLPSCQRFLVMLYRKVRALRQSPRVVVPAVACPTLRSTSSATIDDAILHCKKFTVSGPQRSNELNRRAACTYVAPCSL